MTKKAVIFDCDGVLVNTEEILAQAERELLAEYGISYTLEDRAKLTAGVEHKVHMQRISDDFNRVTGKPLPEDFWVRLWKRDEELKKTMLRPTDGVRELLLALKSQGIPFAVASNAPMDMLEPNLKQLGLYELFAPHVYSSDHVPHPKPAPDIYLMAAGKLGVDPKDCVVVEDSSIGITAGTAAGAHVIGFTGGYSNFHVDFGLLMKSGARETHPHMREVKKRVFALLGLPEAGFTPPAP